MNWIDTNPLIAICTCAIGLTQFLFWRYIAKNKAYESEKGKNLATKEDIAGITKEIESVKDSYNKSLETHKIELQKKFESYKYIKELCNSIDKELLRKLVVCKKEMENDFRTGRDNDDYGSCEPSIKSLYDYLKSYDVRYKHNKNVKLIFKHYEKIEGLNESFDGSFDEPFDKPKYIEELGRIHSYVDRLIAEFLPKWHYKIFCVNGKYGIQV